MLTMSVLCLTVQKRDLDLQQEGEGEDAGIATPAQHSGDIKGRQGSSLLPLQRGSPKRFVYANSGLAGVNQSCTLPAAAASPAGPGAAAFRTTVLSTSLKQFYVSTWAAGCFCGMVIIVIIFMSQTVANDVWMDDSSIMIQEDSMLDVSTTPITVDEKVATVRRGMMGKDTAMLLVFAYAGLGWMMSNGLVLSPRPRRIVWGMWGSVGLENS
jgi:hypothetical protein